MMESYYIWIYVLVPIAAGLKYFDYRLNSEAVSISSKNEKTNKTPEKGLSEFKVEHFN